MTEAISHLPKWALIFCLSGAGLVITALIGILIWFLRTFLQDNKESWKQIKESINTLVVTTTKHDIKIFELEKDVLEMRSDLRGLPHIKSHR